jgi:primosomal protein N'
MPSDAHDTVTCENCGQQRYTWEACPHCDHVHWRDDVDA